MRRRTDMERARVVELARDVLEAMNEPDSEVRDTIIVSLHEPLVDALCALDVAEARRAGERGE